MAKSLKVGMLVDTYLPVIGGAEIHVLELSRALRTTGVSPVVCTATASDGEAQQDEFPVTRIPALHYAGWRTWLRLPFALPALAALHPQRGCGALSLHFLYVHAGHRAG